ncbi:hypothetical protein HYALB_00007400 [Hymenoscyphus albidus]|uniref:CENP-V/GFA domain-containing protein n=1 Tax=Hymenoscyphus albidus TaxID=595503 RepID=A0A9N9QAI5_9HELO|nr:hypothetical protein HYALB_00007400 [Hymenoscyphus albidus]
MATTTVNATCACKAFTYAIEFPNSSLPKSRALCLCTMCRQETGSCGISYIRLPSDHTLDPAEYNLISFTPKPSFTRYFCSTCGSHVLFSYNGHDGNSWHMSTGIWDKTEGIVNWTGTKWIEGTLDGGISVWLKDIEDQNGTKRALPRCLFNDGDGKELIAEGALQTLPPRERTKEQDEKLQARCYCGGVKFYITRPNDNSKKAESPYSDLIVPFHSGSNANPEKDPWFLRSNDTKYLAGLCTCTSCRENSGFEIQPWAFVPKCNIFKEDGTPLDFDFGTLKRYGSSEGVMREFCKVCGATVFWHCDWRPSVIDVSPGLLDPEEGARVESWLDWWTDRVSFSEMAVSKNLVKSLEEGMKG